MHPECAECFDAVLMSQLEDAKSDKSTIASEDERMSFLEDDIKN